MTRPQKPSSGPLLLGGMVGGVVLGTEFSLANLFSGGLTSIDLATLGLALVLAALVSLYAAVIFMIGMICLGWPVWALVHHHGLRSAWIAILLTVIGVTAAGIALFAVFEIPPVPLILAFPLPSAAAGWTVWKSAYRKSSKPPRPSPARLS